MEYLLIILLMIGIGAVIGGMTNFLAIKMLFRPYRPIYLNKLKLPFTPGLIPKRQGELAEQLGKLVTNHLVTAQAIRDKLENSEFKQKIVELVNQRVERFLYEDGRTVFALLQEFNSDLTIEQLEAHATSLVEQELVKIYHSHQSAKLSEVLPEDLKHSTDQQIPDVASYILSKVDQYINSAQGQRELSEAASKFLATQGFLGNMVSSFLGEEGLIDKITPAVNQYIRSGQTQTTVENLIRNEWNKWQETEISIIRERFFDDLLEKRVATYMIDEMNISEHVQQPLSAKLQKWESLFKEQITPKLTNQLFHQLSQQVETLMKTLGVSEMVQKEVDQFDVVRLEKMVLEITKREFTMITYLGAVLGGTIGLIQGVIVIFIS
ncbi:DUF445 domain-containing protein [Alkalibacillus aidingensis]|uniref:DUF445 domain-containing protein n=1 Tax=Alkalibacillus aidingensis TaxID=2747607 RepID=UPI00166010AC|nr:DUF445 family protein [Alkalibacillus aidingensis]